MTVDSLLTVSGWIVGALSLAYALYASVTAARALRDSTAHVLAETERLRRQNRIIASALQTYARTGTLEFVWGEEGNEIVGHREVIDRTLLWDVEQRPRRPWWRFWRP
jgi:hypothetical protein